MFRYNSIAKIYPSDYRKASKAANALILKCAEAKIREEYPKHFDGDHELQEEPWLFWSMFYHIYGDKNEILTMVKDEDLVASIGASLNEVCQEKYERKILSFILKSIFKIGVSGSSQHRRKGD
jgi:hypothetical protein